jgi:hypothetical protein
MNKKYIVIAAILPIIVLVIVSCDLFPPENTLELAVEPYYTDLDGINITIHFWLKNTGSDTLQNCKVKWYVDDSKNGSLDFTDITGWAPALGVDLAGGATSDKITVNTTTGVNFLDVEYFGVYAWGWDNPPDE